MAKGSTSGGDGYGLLHTAKGIYTYSELCFGDFLGHDEWAACDAGAKVGLTPAHMRYFINTSTVPIEVVDAAGMVTLVNPYAGPSIPTATLKKLNLDSMRYEDKHLRTPDTLYVITRTRTTSEYMSCGGVDANLDKEIKAFNDAVAKRGASEINHALGSFDSCVLTQVSINHILSGKGTGIALPVQGLTVGPYNGVMGVRTVNRTGRFDACLEGFADYYASFDVVYRADRKNCATYYWNSPAGPTELIGEGENTNDNTIRVFYGTGGERREIGRAHIEEALKSGIKLQGHNGRDVVMHIYESVQQANEVFVDSFKDKDSQYQKAIRELEAKYETRAKALRASEVEAKTELERLKAENIRLKEKSADVAAKERQFKTIAACAAATVAIIKGVLTMIDILKPKKKPVPKPPAEAPGFVRSLINYYRMV